MVVGRRILIIDFTNFEDYPVGGYLTFARNMMESFGSDMALVGISTNNQDPIGEWFTKKIDGVLFDFFAIARYDKSTTKHFFPDRLASYFLLKYHKKAILKIRINNIFIQRQEILMAFNEKSLNICYSFAGLENPLSFSKYSYAQFLAKSFERFFFKKLFSVRTILARGDENAISQMVIRSNGEILKSSVNKFPTRINTEVFKPLNKMEVRQKLGFPATPIIIGTTGRLAYFKGWKFLIDCFIMFEKRIPDCKFYFIGDGEDKRKIKDYILINNMTEKIILGGKKGPSELADFLNASDLFIMGSYKEGWSTSLMEAIACGIPACVTEFSSANEIIIEGESGHVIKGHNENLFVEGMINALSIKRPVKNDNVVRFSTRTLKEDILKHWRLS